MATEPRSRRSLFGRLAVLGTAKPDPTFTPPPITIADGLWALERRVVVVLGLTLPCRSTLIRLKSGGLLVHSPPPLDDIARAALDTLGPVTAIVAPNSFHHTYVPHHARAFPRAQVFLAPGLAQRIPGLPPGVTPLPPRPAPPRPCQRLPHAGPQPHDAVLGPLRGRGQR